MRYFVAVADARNFTKAARACLVAQSALSQQIKRLEGEVGGALFSRGRGRVELTAAGQVLLPLARRVVSDEAAARSEMQAYFGLAKGRLRLGLTQTGGDAVDVVGVVSRFRTEHPGIDIQIVSLPSSDMVTAVRTGDLDLAVVGLSSEELPADVGRTELVIEPLVAVLMAGDAAGFEGPVSVADLAQRMALLQFTAGTGMRRHVEEAMERAGIDVETKIEISYAPDLMRFAVHGVGVAIVPLSLAVSARPTLDALGQAYEVAQLADHDARHYVTAVYDTHRLPASGHEFLSLLCAPPTAGCHLRHIGISKSDRQ